MLPTPPPWSTVAAVLLLLLTAMSAVADEQFEQDKKECAPQLAGLSPCLPYVSRNAKTPTMDCCTALKQVLAASKKCLCLLIKYRDEPGLGVKIDTNLALSLPVACHASSNTSDCPALLHLAPNSADAKVFTDFAKRTNTSSTTNTSSYATSTPVSTGGTESKANGYGLPIRRFGALPIVYAILLVFFFLISCPI